MTAATHTRTDRTTARRRAIVPLLALPLLAGCGGARLGDEVATTAAGPPPARLLVATDAGHAIAGGVDPALALRTATTLTGTIVDGLQRHGIRAEFATNESVAPDVARLSLALRRVEEGSRFQRVVLGFGLGQSRIEVTARLRPPGATSVSQDLLAFEGSAHSGYRPGLVKPLRAGLGARGAMALAGAAGVGAAEMRGRGPDQDLRDLAEAIVERTVAYYRSVGWGAETAPPSRDGGSALAAPVVEAPRRG